MCHHLSGLWVRFGPTLLDEVLAGAERLVAGAGDNGDAEARLFVEPVEECVGLPVGGIGQRVHSFRAVDGHEEDVRGGIGEKIGGRRWRLGVQAVCHGCDEEYGQGRFDF